MNARDQECSELEPVGQPLRVRVNDELVLDAGTCYRLASSEGPLWRIEPPATTLFRQLLDYLEAKPDPTGPRSGTEALLDAYLTAA